MLNNYSFHIYSGILLPLLISLFVFLLSLVFMRILFLQFSLIFGVAHIFLLKVFISRIFLLPLLQF